MIEYDTIKKGFYDWAVAVTGKAVIWENQNAPKPDLPYITLFMTSIQRVGDDYQATSANGSGVIEITGNRDFTLQVQALGEGAIVALESLSSSLQMPTVLETLRNSCIVFVQNITPIQDISGLWDSQFIPRGMIDFQFRTASETTDTPGYFDQVSGEGKLNDASGSTITTIPIGG